MIAVFSLTTGLALIKIAAALTDCYYYNGWTSANNTICSGSSTCCGPTAVCESYRLCHNKGDPPDIFVRGPCAVSPWNEDVCPQICLYNETTGVFPRVKQCPDQSWCCSNQTGAAVANDVAECCNKGSGVFIDALGHIVTSSSSAAPSPTSIATRPASTIPASTSVQTARSSEPAAANGLSTASKTGIGIAVAVGALAVAAIAGWLIYRKRHTRQHKIQPYYAQESKFYPGPSAASEAASTPLSELPLSGRSLQSSKMAGSFAVELVGSTPSGSNYSRYELDAHQGKPHRWM